MKFPRLKSTGGTMTGDLPRMEQDWQVSSKPEDRPEGRILIIGVYIENLVRQYFYNALPEIPIFRGRVERLAAERYQEYIGSDRWKELRVIALAVAGNRCQVCNSSQHLHVHHRTYERLGYELISDLTVLCDECHELFHEAGKVKPSFSPVI